MDSSKSDKGTDAEVFGSGNNRNLTERLSSRI